MVSSLGKRAMYIQHHGSVSEPCGYRESGRLPTWALLLREYILIVRAADLGLNSGHGLLLMA